MPSEARRLERPRPAYRLLRRRLLTPLLLTCEHASSALPRGLRARRPDAEILGTHRGLDLGAWEVARCLSAMLRATAVGGRYSRLVVDLNRAPGDSTLVPSQVDGRPLSFNQRLTPREVGRRVLRYHAPYHSEIDRQVARRVWRGVRPLLLSVHSFTPVLEGRAREFDLGVLYAEGRELGRGFAALLGRRGFTVALNRPYSGRRGFIYAAARHGANYLIPYLELEVNQALLRDEAAARRVALRISPALEELVAGTLNGEGPPRSRLRARRRSSGSGRLSSRPGGPAGRTGRTRAAR